MALPNVTINRSTVGLGRPLPGEDHFSGYLHYLPSSATLPTVFQGGNNIKKLLAISDLEALGIAGKSEDETKANATLTVTNKGTDGDVYNVYVGTTFLGSYTKVSGDNTTDAVALGIQAAIDANFYLHGFATLEASSVITVKAPTGMGLTGNSLAFANTQSAGATMVVTVGTFSGGVGSQYDVAHYHASEFFRIQPQGILWFGLYTITSSPSTYSNFTEVVTMQNYANGAIRQMAVYANTTAFSTSHLNALQSRATDLQADNKPLSIIYQGDFKSTTVSSALSLRALNNKNVSATIGQDLGGVGNTLYNALGKSVGILGIALGAVSLAKVSESIMWVSKFETTIGGTELQTLGFATGESYSSQTTAMLNQLDGYGYIFLRKIVGLDGSYFNNDHCAVSVSSSYAYIKDNRTIDKTARQVRSALLPALGATLYFNSDGTLSAGTLGYVRGLSDNALNQMTADGDISASQTVIDPNQNVQSTGILNVTVKEIETGTARNIAVNIGYVNALS